MRHLSGVDASFLHLETPETPMHVGSLMLLELPRGYQGDYGEDLKAMIGRRLHLASVLTRKLARMPFELAEPVWIDDDAVDLDDHVRSATLRRPGTMAQLHQLVAQLHSTLLDRSRPLWEMVVIDGLENGQVAVYTKAHHSGVDGKAGVELAKVLYDSSSELREVPPPPRRRHGCFGFHLGVAELLQSAVQNSVQQYLKAAQLLPTAVKALGAAGTLIAARKTAPGERPLDLGLAPKTIFNALITSQRSYSTWSVPLADLKALGRRVGGTVNTIVLALCSSALRRFLKARQQLPDQTLVAMVPVSLRAAGDEAMNNQVSVIRVDLASEIDDPAARFEAIHTSSEAAKAVVRELKPVLAVDMPVAGAPWIMTSLASLYGRSNLASQLPPAGNVVISNVPGPPSALYVAGARMTHYYPVSIPYHGAGLNITLHSYAGSLEFGLIACCRMVSQADSYELIEHLKAALQEIEALPSLDRSAAPATTADPPSRSADAAATGPAAGATKPPRRARQAAAAPAARARSSGKERAR